MPNPSKFVAGCPKCGGETTVKDMRPLQSGDVTRRRECNVCGHRYTTLEIVYDGHARNKEVARWAAQHNRGMIDDGE